MYPLYHNMDLDDHQCHIVSKYLHEVGFCFSGTQPSDFQPIPFARYIGWNFQAEDLEAFAIPLRCTKPGYEKYHTFIRMSRGQLLGTDDAPRLPVNKPVLANEALRMQRWRDTPTGPSRTGLDSYTEPESAIPGVDIDFRLLEDELQDICDFYHHKLKDELRCQFDLSVEWGTLLSGRYARLVYFRKEGRLNPTQLARLEKFEDLVRKSEDILRALKLPTLETLRQPERRRHPQHNSLPSPV